MEGTGKSSLALSKSSLTIHLVNKAFRHSKTIAFLSNGVLVMKAAKFPKVSSKDGVIIGGDASAIDAFIQALHQHRFQRRIIDGVPA